MQRLIETFRKLAMLPRRRQLDADLDEEMRFHLEMRAKEHREGGGAAGEAACSARRRFGNTTLLRESAREAWTWPSVESVLRDMRLALRTLRRSPGFVTVSLASLALGIGVNVAVFSFINSLFLRPLPGITASDRLVSIYQRYRAGSQGYTGSAYPDFEYYRRANRSFSDVLAYTRFPMTINAGDRAETVNGELVSPNYFTLLGVAPAVGRMFASTSAPLPGADPVVVLGFEFWQRRFGADPGIVGRVLQVGTTRLSIIGVAPPRFRGVSIDWDEAPALWVPVSMYKEAVPALADGDFLHSWGAQTYQLVGRLKPGVTFRQAAADMTGVARRIFTDNPDRLEAWPRSMVDYSQTGVELHPAIQAQFSPELRGTVLGFLGLLGVAAILVFAISCFNVASLVLARTTRRHHELAIRLSLGAGRARLVRQLLTENIVLAALGGGAGLLVARATTGVLARFGPAFRVSLPAEAAPDARVLAFTGIVAVACGLALTLLPARLASRGDINAIIKTEGGTAGVARLRGHNALVAMQVAVSVVLLVGAGLFVRTLRNAHAVDVTENAGQVLLAKIDLTTAGYDAARGSVFYPQLLDRLHAVPGVTDAAFVFVVPLGGRRGGTDVVLEPSAAGGPRRTEQVGFNVVTPRYFRTIGLPVVAGRAIEDTDREGTLPVAVINEVMAQRLFPGRSPIGERFLLQWPPQQIVQVVGVVRDGRFRSYRAEMEPTVYVPLAQRYFGQMNLEVRAAGSAPSLAGPVVAAVAALDKQVALTGIQTLQSHFDRALAQERLTAFLLGGLALLALLLAAVGIYGMLSYSVAQRTREIGMRIALGARPAAVVRMVLARVMRLVAVGLGAGAACAAGLTRLVRGLLFGVEPYDAMVFLAAASALVAAAAVAGYLPARHAAKVDPVVALRYE